MFKVIIKAILFYATTLLVIILIISFDCIPTTIYFELFCTALIMIILCILYLSEKDIIKFMFYKQLNNLLTPKNNNHEEK